MAVEIKLGDIGFDCTAKESATDTPADLAARCDGNKLPLPTGERPSRDHLAWIMSGMPKVGRTSVDIHVFDSLRAELTALRERLAAVEGESERERNQIIEDQGKILSQIQDENKAAYDLWAASQTDDTILADAMYVAGRQMSGFYFYRKLKEAKADAAALREENGRLREANVRLERLVHIMGDKMGWMVSVVSGEGKRWEEDGNKAVALSFALVTETIVKGHGYEPDGECMAEFDELIAALGITLDAAEGGENGSA